MPKKLPTREDLIASGFPPEEADVILRGQSEQRARSANTKADKAPKAADAPPPKLSARRQTVSVKPFAEPEAPFLYDAANGAKVFITRTQEAQLEEGRYLSHALFLPYEARAVINLGIVMVRQPHKMGGEETYLDNIARARVRGAPSESIKASSRLTEAGGSERAAEELRARIEVLSKVGVPEERRTQIDALFATALETVARLRAEVGELLKGVVALPDAGSLERAAGAFAARGAPKKNARFRVVVQNQEGTSEQIFSGWEAIATFLGVSVQTARVNFSTGKGRVTRKRGDTTFIVVDRL